MKEKKLERHERMYGPHFNEECALKAVAKMQNEDGTNGQHWSVSESVALANRYGVSFNTDKYNKYDWYVALNMVYSDYYQLVRNNQISDTTKFFVELAKYWLKDKDVDEGKMWYYFKYVMCDVYHEDYDDYEEEEYEPRRAMSRRASRGYNDDYRMRYTHDRYADDYDEDYKRYNEPSHERIISRY